MIRSSLVIVIFFVFQSVYADDTPMSSFSTISVIESNGRIETYLRGHDLFDNTLEPDLNCLKLLRNQLPVIKADPQTQELVSKLRGIDQEIAKGEMNFHFYYNRVLDQRTDGVVKERYIPNRLLIFITPRPYSEIREGQPGGIATIEVNVSDRGDCDLERIKQLIAETRPSEPGKSVGHEEPHYYNGIPANMEYRLMDREPHLIQK